VTFFTAMGRLVRSRDERRSIIGENAGLSGPSSFHNIRMLEDEYWVLMGNGIKK
jgi:hypothetical protein